jgi:hypothetical protein
VLFSYETTSSKPPWAREQRYPMLKRLLPNKGRDSSLCFS